MSDSYGDGFVEDIKSFPSLTQFTKKQYTYALYSFSSHLSLPQYKIRKIEGKPIEEIRTKL